MDNMVHGEVWVDPTTAPLLTTKLCKFSTLLGYISHFGLFFTDLDTRPLLFTNLVSGPAGYGYHTTADEQCVAEHGLN